MRRAWIATAAGGTLLAGCTAQSPSTLDPAGPGAAVVANLWWVMLALGTAVFVGVCALLVVAMVRSSRSRAAAPSPRLDMRIIVAGGVVLPIVILVPLTVFTTWVSRDLHQPAGDNPALRIEVVGHKFWWEVRYPDEGFVSANEIHVPVGRQIHLDLEASDVIHSFWVPQVHGKLDMIPGQTNQLRLRVDDPGTYLGKCAEYCGVQHANMRFHLVAHEPEDFDAWLRNEASPAAEPADDAAQRGLDVFLNTTCVACHAIRGTPADATLGPDLTHIASRARLGAGTVPNTQGWLAGWIIDPQPIKPGNLMPPTNLEPDELHDLVHYLMTLR